MDLSFLSNDEKESKYTALLLIVREHLTARVCEIDKAIEKLISCVKPRRRKVFLDDAIYMLDMAVSGYYDDETTKAAAISAANSTKAIVAAKLKDTTGVYYNAKQIIGDLVYTYMVVELMLNTLVDEYLKELCKEHSSPISVTN